MAGLAGGGDTIPDCDRSIYFFQLDLRYLCVVTTRLAHPLRLTEPALYHLGQACIRMALPDVSEIFRDRTT